MNLNIKSILNINMDIYRWIYNNKSFNYIYEKLNLSYSYYINPIRKYVNPYLIRYSYYINPIRNYLNPYLIRYSYNALYYITKLQMITKYYLISEPINSIKAIYILNKNILYTSSNEINNIINNKNNDILIIEELFNKCFIRKILLPNEQYKINNYIDNKILSAELIYTNNIIDITDILNKYLRGTPNPINIPIKYILNDSYNPIISNNTSYTLKIITEDVNELEFTDKDLILNLEI